MGMQRATENTYRALSRWRSISHDSEMSTDRGTPGISVLEETETETKTGTDPASEHREDLARLWKVICHDDPVTTMDFVVDVLTSVFRQPAGRAVELMVRVHETGSAVIGLWPETVAKRKVNKAKTLARADGFPLTFSLEEDD